MADLKISQLSDGGAAQAADEFVVARSGNNFRVDGASVAAAATSVGTLSALTVSGDLTVDTSTLKVDAANNRVGIGTASPAQRLDVAGSIASNGVEMITSDGSANYLKTGTTLYLQAGSTTLATLTSSGNLAVDTNTLFVDAANNRVGIGTASPASTLDVAGKATVSASVSGDVIANIVNTHSNGFGLRVQGGGTNYIAAFNDYASNSKMVLDGSGNLGVGTASPTNYGAGYRTIAANGTSSGVFEIQANGTVRGLLVGDSTDFQIQANGAIPMRFFTNGNERARITSGGYLKASNDGTYNGVSSSYHEARQTVNGEFVTILTHTGNSTPNGVVVAFTAASPDNNTQYFLRCEDSTTQRLYIWSDGDLANHDGVYGTISDAKLKQDITDAPSQWDDLKAVRFRKYRMKSDVAANPDAPYLLGVVAQELQATSPGLVDAHPDTEQVEIEVAVERTRPVLDDNGTDTGETETYTETETRTEQRPTGTETLSVKSSILLMKAAVALQEAMARIEALEARLAALESVE